MQAVSPRAKRHDFDAIAAWIRPGAHVLDLGCGDGSLLRFLRERRGASGYGIEIDAGKLLASVRNGVNVIQIDLESGLSGFEANSFDYVILSQTLQAVHHTETLIKEMLRVGRQCIVSIPNFAYHRLRHMLAEEGRAPKSVGVLRNEWYNTPNIRFFTIADFEDFCRAKNIRVHKRVALDTEADTEVFKEPNLNADLAIFVISRA